MTYKIGQFNKLYQRHHKQVTRLSIVFHQRLYNCLILLLWAQQYPSVILVTFILVDLLSCRTTRDAVTGLHPEQPNGVELGLLKSTRSKLSTIVFPMCNRSISCPTILISLRQGLLGRKCSIHLYRKTSTACFRW